MPETSLVHRAKNERTTSFKGALPGFRGLTYTLGSVWPHGLCICQFAGVAFALKFQMGATCFNLAAQGTRSPGPRPHSPGWGRMAPARGLTTCISSYNALDLLELSPTAPYKFQFVYPSNAQAGLRCMLPNKIRTACETCLA